MVVLPYFLRHKSKLLSKRCVFKVRQYTLANSDGPDEMPHETIFHQGMYYLLRRTNDLKIKEHNFEGIPRYIQLHIKSSSQCKIVH